MMDLTPLEVRKKKGDFRRQIRGYDPESVDDFLDLVADRMEQLVRDNATLQESSGRFEQQVTEYREREKALTEALVSAQQLREEMRVRAVKEAEAARSQAEKDADQHRSQAAEEADRARREAREILERAQAEACRELEEARNRAEAEAAQIRAEIERTRDRESATIQALQERRALLLDSYRALLEREMAGLATLPAVREDDPVEEVHDTVASAVEPARSAPDSNGIFAETTEEAELPEMSADLAALIEAAESDVDDLAWSSLDGEVIGEEETAVEAELELEGTEPEGLLGAGDAIDDVVDARLFGPAATGELVLEDATRVAEQSLDGIILEEVEDDDAWLSSLVDGATGEAAPPAPRAEERTARRPAWEQEDVGAGSDEDFIDSLIAQAGVAPPANGASAAEAPSFLDETDEEIAEAGIVSGVESEAEVIERLDEEPIVEVAAAGAEPQSHDDAPSVDDGRAPVAVESSRAEEPSGEIDPLDSIDVLDGDEGFDALFGEGDDDPADFDFDAALVTATGFGGGPEPEQRDGDNAFDLGIELDDTKSPLDLGRGGAGPFGSLDDIGFSGTRNGFSPSSRGELTLRPLSPEEEAPDLPAESRPRDESDDDMFSTMFRGRE